MGSKSILRLAVAAGASVFALTAVADDKHASVEIEDGKHYNADGDPTYNVKEDGTVDWYTYSGFRRYHAECHVCHGPDGEGSTYAPALKASALDMTYDEFMEAVASGIKRVDAADNQVMPAFGDNVNVWCFVDDIYVYLKARGTEAVPRGRPPKKDPKSDTAREYENDCLG